MDQWAVAMGPLLIGVAIGSAIEYFAGREKLRGVENRAVGAESVLKAVRAQAESTRSELAMVRSNLAVEQQARATAEAELKSERERMVAERQSLPRRHGEHQDICSPPAQEASGQPAGHDHQ